ncbi:hypothetical protein [Flexivirga alba]
MIGHIERSELVCRLNGRADAASLRLLAALSAEASTQLVPVNEVESRTLTPVYEVRLALARSGNGPFTLGLAEWIAELYQHKAVKLANVTAGRVFGLCLLDAGGGVLAVTTDEPRR